MGGSLRDNLTAGSKPPFPTGHPFRRERRKAQRKQCEVTKKCMKVMFLGIKEGHVISPFVTNLGA